jgi:hypothetical protein
VLLLSAPPYVLHPRALPSLQGHQHLPRPWAHEQPRVLLLPLLARPKTKRRSLRFACVEAAHHLVPLKRTIAVANAAASTTTTSTTSITCTVICTTDTAVTPRKPSPTFGNLIGSATTATTTAIIAVVVVVGVSGREEARVEASAATAVLLVGPPPPPPPLLPLSPRQRAVAAPRVTAANGALDVARVRAVDNAVALALADRVEGVLVQAVVRRRRRPTVPV